MCIYMYLWHTSKSLLWKRVLFTKVDPELFLVCFCNFWPITCIYFNHFQQVMFAICTLFSTLTIKNIGWKYIKTTPRPQEFYRAPGFEIPGSATPLLWYLALIMYQYLAYELLMNCLHICTMRTFTGNISKSGMNNHKMN